MTRLVLRALSWLLPPDLRSDWVREWEAEIWYARKRGARSGHLHNWLLGALADACCLGFDREILSRRLQAALIRPGVCLAGLSLFVLAIAAVSGGLPSTRAVLFPLPYSDPHRVATIARGESSLSMRGEIPARWVRLWSQKSTTLEAIATYSWKETSIGNERLLAAETSPNFFSMLGVPARVCSRCVLLSASFLREHFPSDRDVIGRDIVLDSTRYRISGVLPADFWFLSHKIAAWVVEPTTEANTAVVARLRKGIPRREAEGELCSLLRQASYSNTWASLAEVSLLEDRVRSPLGSYLLALALALFAAAFGAHPRIANLDPRNTHIFRRGAFFAAKTTLLLLAVLLIGLEFTSACSITMIGGTDLLAEPLSTWLFLLGCMAALTWSIHDQCMRCRVCLHRLGLAAHVGCPGSLLLNWAGTELVCVSGHGMLHVPEMRSCWLDAGRWTALDSSWRELFVHDA